MHVTAINLPAEAKVEVNKGTLISFRVGEGKTDLVHVGVVTYVSLHHKGPSAFSFTDSKYYGCDAPLTYPRDVKPFPPGATVTLEQ